MDPIKYNNIYIINIINDNNINSNYNMCNKLIAGIYANLYRYELH